LPDGIFNGTWIDGGVDAAISFRAHHFQGGMFLKEKFLLEKKYPFLWL
jgi:hypothetical protein